MAIDIPPGGFTERQAEEAISGIIQRSLATEEGQSKDEPRADDTELDKSVQESIDERADKNAELTDREAEQFQSQTSEGSDIDSQDASVKEQTDADREIEENREAEEYEYDYSALAQALGIGEDELVIDDGKINVRTKINGQIGQTSLNELKHNYQVNEAARSKIQELDEEKRQFNEERKTKLEELGKQSQLMEQGLYAMQQEYLSEFNNVNWDQMKRDDPENYTVRRMEFQDRERRMQKFYGDYQEAQKKIQDQFNTQMREVWDEGAKQLTNAFSGPSYKNSPKWNSEESDKLTKWMISQGFPAEVISTLGSWHVFKWARDSMLREEEFTKTKKVMKKVVKLPKVKTAKPGASSSKNQKSRSHIDEAKARQRKAANKGQKNFNETVDLITKIIRSP